MLYHVSDIHVEHKVDFDSLPDVMPVEEFGKIISAIVDEVFASTMPHDDDDYLFIMGDTCESIHIGKLFYGRLVQLWKPDHIIVTLGNHELWTADQQWTDEDEKIKPDLKDIIAAWREVFNDLGIVFLQNETYDIPEENEYYVHRIGRTGRAKKKGVAWSLVGNFPEKAKLDEIAKFSQYTIRPMVLAADGSLSEEEIKPVVPVSKRRRLR